MCHLFDTRPNAFQAACNVAVESSMRPIKKRVLNRLKRLCVDDMHASKLPCQAWEQAESEVLKQPELPWRERLVQNRFVELLGNDPQWKNLVLSAVIQERRWSDLWTHGYEMFSDRLLSLLEKLVSPHHPAARVTTGALTSIVAVLAAAWIPHAIGTPDLYEKMFRPLLGPLQTTYVVPIDLKPQADNEAVVHVKIIVDNDKLIASLTPVIKPNDLKVTLHPGTDAPIKFIPQIQYPIESSEKANSVQTQISGLKVNLLPSLQLSAVPQSLWDPKAGFKVSVTELEAPVESRASGEATSHKDRPEFDRVTRPLDRIGSDLEALGSDFQAAKSDPQSNLAALQQNQNAIHAITANHGRTAVLGATPRSVHSLVLQWVGEDNLPKACALTLRFEDITGEKLNFTVTNQVCSPNTSLVDKLDEEISVGPGEPKALGAWILSVDEIRRRWIFQHGATLRFTWQPPVNKTVTVTQASKLP